MSSRSRTPTQETAKDAPKWSQERRLEFIDFRLRWDGQLNRSDLTDFFGISVPQASLDIARYAELAPQNLVYDRSSKVYQATRDFRPLSASNQPQNYLNGLLASAEGVRESAVNFIGWQPPIDRVPQPGRVVDADTLAALLKAIRESSGLKVVYQSMSQPDPAARTISPHALAFDGLRWHVRAYCHTRNDFRDFVLGRILDVEAIEPVGRPASEDTAWNTVLTLVLAPHPGLSDGKRQAIELDYGMRDGEVKLKCRQALLFYTLRRLELGMHQPQSPESRQIVLKNEAEIAPYLTASPLSVS
jgi:hypothetical protein